MTRITFADVATVVDVLVDDWYQDHGRHLRQGQRGAQPVCTDSEVITLLLWMDCLPFPGESQCLGFIRAHHLALFPRLLDPSQFNRRTRSLRLRVEALRRHGTAQLGATLATQFRRDTQPVPVVGYPRSKKHSNFAGSASYGVCVSRNLKCFGYKPVLRATREGLPVVCALVPAHTDERAAADTVLSALWHGEVLGDKGFLGAEWQQAQWETQSNRIGTPTRINQRQPHAPTLNRWLHGLRERIESTVNEVQNTGRNLERLLRKTVLGWVTQVIAQRASHTLKHLLRRSWGIDVQTYTVRPV